MYCDPLLGADMTTAIMCCNMDGRKEPWRELMRMDADVALLQEAKNPPADAVHLRNEIPRAHWDSYVAFQNGRFKRLFGRWPMIVKFSDQVEIDRFRQVVAVSETACDEFWTNALSLLEWERKASFGTLAAVESALGPQA